MRWEIWECKWIRCFDLFQHTESCRVELSEGCATQFLFFVRHKKFIQKNEENKTQNRRRKFKIKLKIKRISSYTQKMLHGSQWICQITISSCVPSRFCAFIYPLNCCHFSSSLVIQLNGAFVFLLRHITSLITIKTEHLWFDLLTWGTIISFFFFFNQMDFKSSLEQSWSQPVLEFRI